MRVRSDRQVSTTPGPGGGPDLSRLRRHRFFGRGPRIAVLLALFAGAGCGAHAEDDAAAVAAVREAFVAGYRAGDVDRLASLYAPDYVDLSEGGPTRDREGMRTALQSTFDQFGTELRVHPDELLVNGSWALERGTFEVTLTPRAGGSPVRLRRRYLEILQRVDGEWRIFRSIDNDLSRVSRDDR